MMTRRAWLASLTAALSGGLGFAHQALAQNMERVSDSPFPYPTYRTRGQDAMAAWERLRAEGRGYPLIIGPPADVDLLAELPELNRGETTEILVAAADVDFPATLLAKRREEQEEAAAEFGNAYDDAEFVGPWPASVEALPGPEATRDILSREPHPEVWLVLLPADDAPTALAMLRYGGWNDCPPVEQHVAAVRSWQARFGFELVSVGHDTIEGRVSRRPVDRDEAIALAREQYAYCADIVDQGVETLAVLGATLMSSDWWFFWWD